MNIFEHRDSFYGCLDSGVTKDSLLSLFRLAKQIKQRLGKQGYLLDNYLSLIFEGLTTTIAFEVADVGFQTGGESQVDFFSLMDGSELKKTNPLEPRMREIYEQQADTSPYQERYTRLCMLLFPLADEMLMQALKEYTMEQVDSMNGVVDEVHLQRLFDQISHLTGESIMEELNQQLKQRFLIAPRALVFAQGMTDDLLYRLTHRDHETSKQMFQLLIDSMPEETGE